MASATPSRARRLTLLPLAAVACLLAGCQAGGAPAAVPTAGPPSGVVVPPPGPPVKVTVAPASVAPGATGAIPTVPALPKWTPPPTVAPCPRYPLPKQIPLQVSPGSGSAAVNWVSDGDAAVRTYRVTAISQRLVAGAQPAAPTVTTARGVGCGPRTVSISGLRRGTAYIFWLEEGIPDPAGGVRFWMAGQSAGVIVP